MNQGKMLSNNYTKNMSKNIYKSKKETGLNSPCTNKNR